MQCAVWRHKDVAAQVDGDGFLRACCFGLAGGFGWGGRRLGLWSAHQVTVDDHVVLDDTFACEDDVFGAEDGGTTRDFVACFLWLG